MEQSRYMKLVTLTETPEAEKKSVSYLHQKMSCFLKKNDRVLLLYPQEDNAACRILEKAVLACGAIPVWIGEDHRWMTILKKAFTTKSSCIVGSPLTLLGLSKLARHMGTPLYAKNVMMVGYPTTHWLVDGVRRLPALPAANWMVSTSGRMCSVWKSWMIRARRCLLGKPER